MKLFEENHDEHPTLGSLGCKGLSTKWDTTCLQFQHNMFAIPTLVIKSNQWQLRSSLSQPMGVETGSQ
jgi:hypothetical protein